MQSLIGRWIIGVTIAGIAGTIMGGICDHHWPRSAKPQAMAGVETVWPTPTISHSADAGKGIEAKLDQLLDAIKGLTVDALKIAYFQGALHGALATALIFAILIAFTRKGAP